MRFFVNLILPCELEDQMGTLITFHKEQDRDLIERLARRVDELDFSVRAHHALCNTGIETVFDLVRKTKHEIRSIKGCGSKTTREIEEVLEARCGFRLGTHFDVKETNYIGKLMATPRELRYAQPDLQPDVTDEPPAADSPTTKPGLSTLVANARNFAFEKCRHWREEKDLLTNLKLALASGLSVSVTDQTPPSLRRFIEEHGSNLTSAIVNKRIEDLGRKIEKIDLVTRRRNDEHSYFDYVIEALKLCDE